MQLTKPAQTTHHHPKPPTTSQNHSKSTQTIQNHQRPGKITHNQPKLPKSNQKQSKTGSKKTLRKFLTQLKGIYHKLSSTEKPYFSVILIWE